jgi:hypothetical protein
MIELLQAKLDTLNYNLNNNIIAKESLSFMLGQQELLMELLDSYYSGLQDYYDYSDAEFEDNNPYYYFSDIDKYMLERRDLIEEQVENAHNNLYFTRGIGKSIINSDNYWFTSDEIEAFRVIWQKRISAI